MYDSSFGWRFVNPKMHAMYGTDAMGETAENLVEKYIVISDEKSKRKYKDILIYPWEQFLNELWSGKLMDI